MSVLDHVRSRFLSRPLVPEDDETEGTPTGVIDQAVAKLVRTTDEGRTSVKRAQTSLGAEVHRTRRTITDRVLESALVKSVKAHTEAPVVELTEADLEEV